MFLVHYFLFQSSLHILFHSFRKESKNNRYRTIIIVIYKASRESNKFGGSIFLALPSTDAEFPLCTATEMFFFPFFSFFFAAIIIMINPRQFLFFSQLKCLENWTDNIYTPFTEQRAGIKADLMINTMDLYYTFNRAYVK